MKKVLSLILFALLATLVTGGILIFGRYRQNPEQIVPYPYTFIEASPAIQLDAPILMVGDQMGAYFAKYKTTLAETISANLAKPIKIQSIAKDHHALHRTIHELKSLEQWPQILIYQGGSEEFSERSFELSEIDKIRENFKRYEDERIETFMILYPWLSRIVYEPIKRVGMRERPDIVELSQEEYIKRLETQLLLFEQELIELVEDSKNRATLLILTTTPINLDVPPKAICEFASTTEIDSEILRVKEEFAKKDLKSAYALSSKLIQQYLGNSKLFYLHGQIAKELGYYDEAKENILLASSYDCDPWRATEVQNSIIRKVAREHQVLLFDFAKYLTNQWPSSTTFFDDLHPQNLYYEKGMEQLGIVIRRILKL